MDTHRQVFGNNLTTTGAFLRGASWVNQCHTPTSVCSFVGGVLHELTPSNIRYAAVDCLVAIRLHIFDVELFKGDELVFVHQLARFLVGEVVAPICCPFVGVAKGFDYLAPFRATLGKALFLTLQSGNVSRVLLHPALAFNGLTVAKIGKGRQAKINPDNVVIRWHCSCRTFTRKTGVPIAYRITLNGQGFDVSTDGTMQLHSHVANLGNGQPIANELKTGLLEGERIIQALALKARVARFFTGFDTAKERLERKFYSLLYVLQDLRMNTLQGWLIGFPLRQKLIGVIQAQRLTILLISVFTSRQRVVINPTAKLKHFFKACSLGASWIKAVLVCQSHRTSVSCFTPNVNCVNPWMFETLSG